MNDILDSAIFDTAAANCRLLTRAEAAHFVDKGYVVVRGAFPRDLARTVREHAWTELKDKHGVDEHAPVSSRESFLGPRNMRGYFRTSGGGLRFPLQAHAPKALAAQVDVVGDVARLPEDGKRLAWGAGAIANLGAAGAAWQPPQPRQPGWHKDGWHFRHFLNSPEQGLLAVPIYSDILPHSGGTFLATDSIRPVARLLARHPEGLHADGVQGAGYLIPHLIEQCAAFEELTGEAGDLAILHPYLLHRAPENPSPRPRFIANVAVVLREPMRFDRPPGDPFSLVEVAVLRALGVERLSFTQTRAAEAYTPSPFRTEDDAQTQRHRLAREMSAMARSGLRTPDWAETCGYMSNRQALRQA